MKAYTKGISKKDFVREMKLHQKADNFISGTYDKGAGGCSVGCALKSVAKLKKIDLQFNDHKNFETHLGVPEWLARVNDTIFEGVSASRRKVWPVEFSKAINEGSDLDQIKTPFIIFILEKNLEYMAAAKYDADKWPDVTKALEGSAAAVRQMIETQKSGSEAGRTAAESAAWSAAAAARSAAESAARSAAESAARSAAESAAWSAAESAVWSASASAWSASASAAWSASASARSASASARSAAESAAWSASASASASARSAAYEVYADKLLELIKQCKS